MNKKAKNKLLETKQGFKPWNDAGNDFLGKSLTNIEPWGGIGNISPASSDNLNEIPKINEK